jgi:predicted RNA-binding Zn ribbon-like protein
MRRAVAPKPLSLVQSFVNTLDLETAEDRIATAEGLRAWLAEHGFAGEPGKRDASRAAAAREGLRGLLEEHSGTPPDPSRTEQLDRALAASRVSIRLVGDAPAVTAEQGLDAALAAMVTAIVRAQADGTWRRLKVCREPGCRWAFYDRSKNRSGAWCDMAVCGGRSKVRAYRARKAAT